MTDPTSEFFRGMAARGVDAKLNQVNVRVRFDSVDNGRTSSWLLTVDDGAVDVSSGTGDADCVLAAERAVFNNVLSGRTNAMAAVLRGEVRLSGDPEVLVVLQRLLPDPAGAPA